MDETDLVFKQNILKPICKGHATFGDKFYCLLNEYSMPLLQDMAEDGLLEPTDHSITVTKLGFHFVRNTYRAFDIKWLTAEGSHVGFSKAM